ncbi:MAG: peptidase [Gemmatimonadetes bacterium]|nr:peptidase [Gemmatimonadota bacterium]
MPTDRSLRRAALASFALALALPQLAARAQQVPTPQQFFGHEIGADYQLPNYTRFIGFWQALAASPRAKLDTIGLTAEGRPQVMLTVSSPENMRKLSRYKEISRKLALAEGLSDAEAKALAAEGKAVMWIDGGLHATEVLGAQQLLETSWQFVTMNDAETTRILNDVIILFVHANPDGMELVSNWYMQETDPKKRNMSIPRLYQKYIGHDNNRDFFMVNQPESENMNRVLYMGWHPQIMYNHHQTGPQGTVMFAPPFRDPANYNFHPSIITGMDLIGAALHGRMVAENKPGVVNRSLSLYSTWWNGGLRTTVYFHNMLGILTETIGNPTPMRIPFLPDRLLRNADQVLPLEPLQEWHFRQSIDYSVTANRAILDLASRYREFFLYNIYKMGKDEIALGQKDTWITTPKLLAEVQAKVAADRTRERGDAELEAFGFGAPAPAQYYEEFRKPDRRVPRAYVLPSDQPDFLTATKFIAALQKNGIFVHRATGAFTAAGKSYPAGSFVVKTAQAFRPHVLDMFEPQDHPNDFKYPGSAPTRPYDNAGWTLALSMGVRFDRILETVDGPLERLDPLADRVKPTAGSVASGGGWIVSPKQNDAFRVVARLWKAGADVYRLEKPAGNASVGAFYIPSNGKSAPVVRQSAADLGVSFTASPNVAASGVQLKAPRIALIDRYGGSMPSGHTKWLMEQYEMPYEVIYPRQVDAGGLRAKYDVVILTDGALPRDENARGGLAGLFGRLDTTLVPVQYRPWLGNLSFANSVPRLREFVEQGGRLIAIGSSVSVGKAIGLPIANHLTERTPQGTVRNLTSDKFYVPGSLLEVAYDTTTNIGRGQDARGVVFFDNGAVFRLLPDAEEKGVKAVAWFDNPAPLKSGWAWGQTYLEGGVTIAEAQVGKGMVFLFGPEILFRATPHGTFKMFFNGVMNGAKVGNHVAQ